MASRGERYIELIKVGETEIGIPHPGKTRLYLKEQSGEDVLYALYADGTEVAVGLATGDVDALQSDGSIDSNAVQSFNEGIRIADDKFISFGDGTDATLSYVEGTNTLQYSGVDIEFNNTRQIAKTPAGVGYGFETTNSNGAHVNGIRIGADSSADVSVISTAGSSSPMSFRINTTEALLLGTDGIIDYKQGELALGSITLPSFGNVATGFDASQSGWLNVRIDGTDAVIPFWSATA